jgi:hypothetical protein
MTKKRRLHLIAGTLAACVVTLGVLAILPARRGVTKANFDLIQEGTTSAEVEAIFDEPPWFDDTTANRRLADWRRADGAVARVIFVDDRAVDMFWFDSTETISEKIRRWLRLPPE